jgi:hypothetical protein
VSIPPTTGLDMGNPSPGQISLGRDPQSDRHRRRFLFGFLGALSSLMLLGGVRLVLVNWISQSPDPVMIGIGIAMVVMGLPLPLYMAGRIKWLGRALYRSRRIRWGYNQKLWMTC